MDCPGMISRPPPYAWEMFCGRGNTPHVDTLGLYSPAAVSILGGGGGYASGLAAGPLPTSAAPCTRASIEACFARASKYGLLPAAGTAPPAAAPDEAVADADCGVAVGEDPFALAPACVGGGASDTLGDPQAMQCPAAGVRPPLPESIAHPPPPQVAESLCHPSLRARKPRATTETHPAPPCTSQRPALLHAPCLERDRLTAGAVGAIIIGNAAVRPRDTDNAAMVAPPVLHAQPPSGHTKRRAPLLPAARGPAALRASPVASIWHAGQRGRRPHQRRSHPRVTEPRPRARHPPTQRQGKRHCVRQWSAATICSQTPLLTQPKVPPIGIVDGPDRQCTNKRAQTAAGDEMR
eukprot:scaffold5521_cov358-Prasinococcus_capsulatus_cf.AAC.3